MVLMIDAEPLLPYLNAVRAARAARYALFTAMKALPEPRTVDQKVAFNSAYKEADHVYADACERLALQVGYDVAFAQKPDEG